MTPRLQVRLSAVGDERQLAELDAVSWPAELQVSPPQAASEPFFAARRRGVAKLGLRALSTNPGAIRLYEKHGFTEEARLRAELRRPDGSYADDVWMSLWLRDLP